MKVRADPLFKMKIEKPQQCSFVKIAKGRKRGSAKIGRSFRIPWLMEYRQCVVYVKCEYSAIRAGI